MDTLELAPLSSQEILFLIKLLQILKILIQSVLNRLRLRFSFPFSHPLVHPAVFL
jgi:hypothetical protein